jgi:hypothetical protein
MGVSTRRCFCSHNAIKQPSGEACGPTSIITSRLIAILRRPVSVSWAPLEARFTSTKVEIFHPDVRLAPHPPSRADYRQITHPSIAVRRISNGLRRADSLAESMGLATAQILIAIARPLYVPVPV